MEDIRLQTIVGARIAELRKARGYDQSVFARMVGINRSYLVSIEAGRRNISLETLSKILSGLDMAFSEFFEGI